MIINIITNVLTTIKRVKLIPVLIASFLSLTSIAQESFGGKPLASIEERQKVSFIEIAPPAEKKLSTARQLSGMLKRFDFALSIPVSIDYLKKAQLLSIQNDTKTYILGIHSKGALSLNFIFSRFRLHEEGKVFIYSASGDYILGGFTNSSNPSGETFAVLPTPGDSVIIEYQLPAESSFDGEIVMESINYDFAGYFKNTNDEYFGLSGSCNVNINCNEGQPWQKEKRSVCRIVYSGTSRCTGTLINNTRNDGTPYILTANHCISSYSVAKTAIFTFQYESPGCLSEDRDSLYSITGSKLIAGDEGLDFTLLQLYKRPPLSYSPYYIGWNREKNNKKDVTSIHHPQGDIMKISFSYDTVVTSTFSCYDCGFDDNAHWKIKEWHVGTTEHGSSGSALFDKEHRLIGDLSGGSATCSYPYDDYYAKFSDAWDKYSTLTHQLKFWLDPLKTGTTTFDGYSPRVTICDSLTNMKLTDISTYYSDANGYYTGHHSSQADQYADKFLSSGQKYLIGALLKVKKSSFGTSDSKITFIIWSSGQTPGTVLYQQDIPLSSLYENEENYIEFDSVVITDSNFFAGYQIYYSGTDTFAAYQAKHRSTDTNHTIYLYKNNQWVSFYSEYGIRSALDMELIVSCEKKALSTKKVVFDKKSNTRLHLYPNPSSGEITLEIPEDININATMYVYNTQGKMLLNKQLFFENSLTKTNLQELGKGMYFIQVIYKDKRYSAPCIIF